MESPTKEEVKKARDLLGLTLTQAVELIHCQRLAWIRYENGDRSMHPAFWELFRLKTGITDKDLV